MDYNSFNSQSYIKPKLKNTTKNQKSKTKKIRIFET